MADGSSDGEPYRRETAAEHLDRNLTELLGELRTALPGVQALFAFLLVVPFNTGFSHVTAFDRDVYFLALASTALAAMLLIAPSVHHRLLFRSHAKAQIVASANRFALAGLTVLAVAMCLAILLVTHVLFGTSTAAIATGAGAVLFAVVWYLLPLATHARH